MGATRSNRNRMRQAALAAGLVAAIVPTLPIGIAHAHPNSHGGQACGTVAFTPQSDDGAFELTAKNVSCETARQIAFAIDAGERSPLSFHCSGTWTEGPGLPHAHWLCTKGDEQVSWVGSPKPDPGQLLPPPRICGPLPPGSYGAVSYIKAWNVSCRRGRQIADRAVRKFCARPGHCPSLPTHIDRGRVDIRGWSCSVRVGHEYTWARCLKGTMRLVSENAS